MLRDLSCVLGCHVPPVRTEASGAAWADRFDLDGDGRPDHIDHDFSGGDHIAVSFEGGVVHARDRAP